MWLSAMSGETFCGLMKLLEMGKASVASESMNSTLEKVVEIHRRTTWGAQRGRRPPHAARPADGPALKRP
jgi:hypothetical protein